MKNQRINDQILDGSYLNSQISLQRMPLRIVFPQLQKTNGLFLRKTNLKFKYTNDKFEQKGHQ